MENNFTLLALNHITHLYNYLVNESLKRTIIPHKGATLHQAIEHDIALVFQDIYLTNPSRVTNEKELHLYRFELQLHFQ
jgi:hypothetical protein